MTNLVTIIGVLTVAFACNAGAAEPLSSKEARSAIETNLKQGDSSSVIEAFFKQRQLPFTYDRFSKRYQSIIREPKSEKHAVVIYINVDSERRFVSGEARDSYTAP